MRAQAYLFYICAAFFLAVDVVYWFWSHDWTGTTALGISVGMAGLVGFYLHFTARRIGAQPEDNPEGEIAEKAGELGFFSPHSWWPLFVAGSTALAALGFVIGWWLFMVGVAAVILTAIGFVFEYYRGNFQH
ncbi:MAG: cytochrome c oxidase subunit 4 [Streptosporangiales bacterium]|nr:cytochrome c oxidase subunit 4 [Streptosporangiales bacterium]